MSIPGLLSGGPARPGRHRSLEALLAWSYQLLDEAECRLLARMSVLRGWLFPARSANELRREQAGELAFLLSQRGTGGAGRD